MEMHLDLDAAKNFIEAVHGRGQPGGSRGSVRSLGNQ